METPTEIPRGTSTDGNSPEIRTVDKKTWLCRHCGYKTDNFNQFGVHMRQEKRRLQTEGGETDDPDEQDGMPPLTNADVLKNKRQRVQLLRLSQQEKLLSGGSGDTNNLVVELMRSNQDLQAQLQEEKIQRITDAQERRIRSLEARLSGDVSMTTTDKIELKKLDASINLLNRTIENAGKRLDRAEPLIQKFGEHKIRGMLQEESGSPPVLRKYTPVELKAFNDKLKLSPGGPGPARIPTPPKDTPPVRTPKPPVNFDDLPTVKMEIVDAVRKKKRTV